MPPIRKKGRMVRAITMIPIPPSHWSRALHTRRLAGCLPKEVITVAPVVVSPDIASKKESTVLRLVTPIENGMLAKAPKNNHVKLVRRNTSRTLKERVPMGRQLRKSKPPTKRLVKEESPKTCTSAVFVKRSKVNGIIIVKPSMTINRPIT